MAINYYVNDGSSKGDIYTTSKGNDDNDGLTPGSPKLSLFAAYKVAKEGDVIYVDTGVYSDINAAGVILFKNEKNIQFVIANKPNGIITKSTYPKDEKVSPDIFYIVNDKPVDREVYMQRINDAKKN